MNNTYSKTNRKSSTLNAMSSMASIIITTIVSFVVSPLFVFYLGSNMFGIWTSIQKYFTFASVADGRTTQALKWIIAKNESHNSDADKKSAIGSAVVISVLLIPISIIVLSIIIYLLPNLINNLSPSDISIVTNTALILGVNILLNPIMGIPDSVLVGTNNGYRSTFIQVFFMVSVNLSMLFCVYLGYGLVTLAIIVVSITLLKFLTVFVLTKSLIPWFGIAKPSKKEVKMFLKFSVWVQLWSFVSRLTLATEVILLGYVINAQTITNYTFTAKQSTIMISIVFLIGNSILPSVGKLYTAKEFQKVKDIIIKINDVVSFLALFFVSFIVLFNESFIKLWVGDSFYLGDISNLLIAILMFQLILIRKNSQLLDACLYVKQKVISGLLGSILSIIIPVVMFNNSNNVNSIFLGIIFGRLLLSISFPIYIKRKYDTVLGLKVYCIFILVIIISYFFKPVISINSWLDFFSYAVIYGLSFVFFLSKYLLNKSTRDILKTLLNPAK